MVQAAKSGKTGEHLAHGGTKLNHRELIIYCRQAAGSFYKEAITKITGYEAYLPGERPPGTEFYTTLPEIDEEAVQWLKAKNCCRQ